MKVTLAKSTATLVVAAGCLALSGGVAQAMPSDINGDRISWNSQLPCSDGGGGMSVSTAPRYLTPGAGYYQERVVVYTSAGARLALSPLWNYHPAGVSWLTPPNWSAYSSYTGQAYATTYIYQFNGTSYVLVARESIPCI